MLRIERSENGQVVFTLSGRMQTEDIEQFQREVSAINRPKPADPRIGGIHGEAVFYSS